LSNQLATNMHGASLRINYNAREIISGYPGPECRRTPFFNVNANASIVSTKQIVGVAESAQTAIIRNDPQAD
jgi:hypothetical protein